MTDKAKAKEAIIAAEYPTISDARDRCPFGGHCASCMYRIESVQTGTSLWNREFTEHDYCRAKY